MSSPRGLFIRQPRFPHDIERARAFAAPGAHTEDEGECHLVFDSIVFDANISHEICSLVKEYPKLTKHVTFLQCTNDASSVLEAILLENKISELTLSTVSGDDNPHVLHMLKTVNDSLKTPSSLNSFRLRIRFLSDRGAEICKDFLSKSESLKHLSFDNTRIESSAIPLLEKGFQSNSWLESVAFAGSKTTDQNFARLASMVQGHPTLKAFGVDTTSCSTESFAALSVVFGSPTCRIEKLDLRPSAIATRRRFAFDSTEGSVQDPLRSFIPGLATNKHLLQLTLAERNLTDGALRDLAQALVENSTLQFLDMSSCNISDSGLLGFVDLLPRMKGLKKLWIGGRQGFCRDSVRKLVLEGLRDNTEIVDLILPRQEQSYFYKRFAYYTSLNAAGRRLLRQPRPPPPSVWPLVLERANKFVKFTSQDRTRVYTSKEDLLYFLIRNGVVTGC